jgi:hypothetical protein
MQKPQFLVKMWIKHQKRYTETLGLGLGHYCKEIDSDVSYSIIH